MALSLDVAALGTEISSGVLAAYARAALIAAWHYRASRAGARRASSQHSKHLFARIIARAARGICAETLCTRLFFAGGSAAQKTRAQNNISYAAMKKSK